MQYAILCWRNASTKELNKLQVHHNRLVETITNSFQLKPKLKPLFQQLNFLKVDSIFILEVAKFMGEMHHNQIPKIFYHYFERFQQHIRTPLAMLYLTNSTFQKHCILNPINQFELLDQHYGMHYHM